MNTSRRKPRLRVWIACIMTLCILAGCSKKQEAKPEDASMTIEAGNTQETEAPEASTEPAVSVDEGLLNVKVSLSMEFMKSLDENFDIEQLKQQNQSYKDVTVEGDAIIITMTKADHRKILGEMATAIDDYIVEIMTGEDTTGLFSSIERNKDCTEITVKINEDETGLMQEMCLLGVRFQCLFYQMFTEAGASTVKTTVINTGTGDIIYSADYPGAE